MSSQVESKSVEEEKKEVEAETSKSKRKYPLVTTRPQPAVPMVASGFSALVPVSSLSPAKSSKRGNRAASFAVAEPSSSSVVSASTGTNKRSAQEILQDASSPSKGSKLAAVDVAESSSRKTRFPTTEPTSKESQLDSNKKTQNKTAATAVKTSQNVKGKQLKSAIVGEPVTPRSNRRSLGSSTPTSKSTVTEASTRSSRRSVGSAIVDLPGSKTPVTEASTRSSRRSLGPSTSQAPTGSSKPSSPIKVVSESVTAFVAKLPSPARSLRSNEYLSAQSADTAKSALSPGNISRPSRRSLGSSNVDAPLQTVVETETSHTLVAPHVPVIAAENAPRRRSLMPVSGAMAPLSEDGENDLESNRRLSMPGRLSTVAESSHDSADIIGRISLEKRRVSLDKVNPFRPLSKTTVARLGE